MGDISMIARRLPDGRVQYGWSGNGGYCRTVGAALLCWYNTPEMVEYLFGLGQVSFLARPLDGNYDGDDKLYTKPIGRPHYWTDSEQKIFGKIAFVDYVYFYDTDNQWYYVSPNRFNAKIPLVAVCEYLGRTGDFLETRLLLQLEPLLNSIGSNISWFWTVTARCLRPTYQIKTNTRRSRTCGGMSFTQF